MRECNMKSAIGISLRKMGCSFNFDTVLQVVSIIPLRHENYLLCALQNRRNVRLIIRQLSFNRFRHPLGGLAQGRVVEMDVAVGGGSSPMPEQASGDMQTLAVHDRVRRVGMPQVVKSRVRHDAGRIARLDPEVVQFMLGQRPVSLVARKHPLPGRALSD